jgi:hypothetical protein
MIHVEKSEIQTIIQLIRLALLVSLLQRIRGACLSFAARCANSLSRAVQTAFSAQSFWRPSSWV